VIGGLELAAGLLVLCWLPVELAVGSAATDSLVKEDVHEGDAPISQSDAWNPFLASDRPKAAH